jgi:hypothetical protein
MHIALQIPHSPSIEIPLGLADENYTVRGGPTQAVETTKKTATRHGQKT